MPKASEVNPAKWSNVLILQDDGMFSAMWGRYEKKDTKSLAVRWNGVGTQAGFPSQGKNPTWFNIPDYLAESVLFDLRSRLIRTLLIGRTKERSSRLPGAQSQAVTNITTKTYIENIDQALEDLAKQKLEKGTY